MSAAEMNDPLVASDDLPLHQTAQPLRRADTQHPGWTERWYFNVQDPESGRLVAIVGGGFYPNTEVLDVYACLLDGSEQSNLRQRVRTSDRSRLDAAEHVRFTIAEPMRRWSIHAAGAFFDVDLNFDATASAFLFPPFQIAADPEDTTAANRDDIQHFVQPGAVTGTITTTDSTTTLAAIGFRDRTWGVRSNRPRLHNWFVGHWPDGGYLTLIHQERADGRVMVSHLAEVSAAGRVQVAVIDGHDLEFDADSRMLRGATYRGHDAEGRTFVLEVANIGPGIRLLGAGYTSEQGQGASDGEAGERWDLAQPQSARRFGRGTIDSPARLGMAWSDGRSASGFGITETAIARDHWRYGRLLS